MEGHCQGKLHTPLILTDFLYSSKLWNYLNRSIFLREPHLAVVVCEWRQYETSSSCCTSLAADHHWSSGKIHRYDKTNSQEKKGIKIIWQEKFYCACNFLIFGNFSLSQSKKCNIWFIVLIAGQNWHMNCLQPQKVSQSVSDFDFSLHTPTQIRTL